MGFETIEYPYIGVTLNYEKKVNSVRNTFTNAIMECLE